MNEVWSVNEQTNKQKIFFVNETHTKPKKKMLKLCYSLMELLIQMIMWSYELNNNLWTDFSESKIKHFVLKIEIKNIKMMMVQQVYPHFVGQSPVSRQLSDGQQTPEPVDIHLPKRSMSPNIIYKPQPVFTRPSSPSSPKSNNGKYGMHNLSIKRSDSVEFYDDERADDKNYESDPENGDGGRQYDYQDNPDEDVEDDNAPLDLSLPVGRRRTYSGGESDDSGGPNEGKSVVDKAAYKKSLMKRYCK